jgi:uncharacterized membrane protein
MKTNGDAIPHWELGNIRRYIRGVIGAAALFAILLVPGLSAGWLFVLAIIGAYESMTAILNADLVYAVFNPGIAASATSNEETVDQLLNTRADEQPAYQEVAQGA